MELGHPNFGRLIECECLQKKRAEKTRQRVRSHSNLSPLRNKTFSNFEQSDEGTYAAYEAARQFANGETDKPWLFLHGRIGTGKTHLAAAIGNSMLERGLAVVFAVVPDLLDELRSAFDPDHPVTHSELFTSVKEAQVLILDDLGTENATSWAREKLFQIINFRYNEAFPTVVTSNQDFKKNARLIDERVLSRLRDTRLSRYIYIDTALDYRQRLDPGDLRN